MVGPPKAIVVNGREAARGKKLVHYSSSCCEEMSFLARRVAASEGAFFSQTSKESIAKLREKAARSSSPKCVESASVSSHEEGNADVLPEILQHSLPEQQFDGLLPSPFSPSPSSLAASLSSSVHSSPSSSHHRMDTNGPLSFLPTLPQASFGPSRWTPAEEEVKILASTANESRMEGMTTMDDARAKALVDGYAIVMKAFLIATALVVGGATVVAGVVGSKLQIRSIDDIPIKGREHMQPRVELIRESFEPWRQWVQKRSRDWNIGDSQRSAASEVLGLNQTVEEVKKE